MKTLLLLLALASAAAAQECKWSVREGSPLYYSMSWQAPNYCDGNAAVYCNAKFRCPGDAECKQGADSTPTDLDCIVTAISEARICAGGSYVGRSCKTDADCPSSTCGGDIVMAWTDYAPTAAAHTISAIRVCLAGAKIGQGCMVDGDCTGSTCTGALVNRVAVATTEPSEVHAVTCCTPEAGCTEDRFCVKRQRWAPP